VTETEPHQIVGLAARRRRLLTGQLLRSSRTARLLAFAALLVFFSPWAWAGSDMWTALVLAEPVLRRLPEGGVPQSMDTLEIRIAFATRVVVLLGAGLTLLLPSRLSRCHVVAALVALAGLVSLVVLDGSSASAATPAAENTRALLQRVAVAVGVLASVVVPTLLLIWDRRCSTRVVQGLALVFVGVALFLPAGFSGVMRHRVQAALMCAACLVLAPLPGRSTAPR